MKKTINNLESNSPTEQSIRDLAVKIKRLRCFKVSYVSATDYKPSRIKIEDTYYHPEFSTGKKYVIKSYNHSYNNVCDCALEYLINLGFIIDSVSHPKDYSLIMVTSFEKDLT